MQPFVCMSSDPTVFLYVYTGELSRFFAVNQVVRQMKHENV